MPDTAIPAAEPAGSLFDQPRHHETFFERTRDQTRFRGACTCGWFRSGPASAEQAIRNEAAVHDIQWVDALNAERVTP